MGNCIVKKSSMHWGGDDWGICSLGSESNFSDDEARIAEDSCAESTDVMTEQTSLLGDQAKGVSSSLPIAAGTKVKIRISKQQLEHLLKDADVRGLSAQEVLAQLASCSDRFEAHRRSWAPALQSIPE